MEGIRGLAVFLVFFVHFDQLIATRLPHMSASYQTLHWLGMLGHSGVDLFFLLSGYWIYAAIRSTKKTIKHFLSRRVQRIYPTFLVVLAAYLVYMLLVPAHSKFPPGAAAASLCLAENALLLPGLLAIAPIITVTWSLSYEILWYTALPALYYIARMKFWSRTARVGLFLGLAGLYGAYSLKCWNTTIPGIPLKPAQHVRLIMFMAGSLVFEITSVSRLKSRIGGRFELVTALLFPAAILTLPALRNGIAEAVPAAMLFTAFGMLGACCLCRPAGFLATAFSFAPLRWLGNMSYSYYLVHALVIEFVRDILARFTLFSIPVVWSILPVSFAITRLAGTVVFLGVERPLSFSAR